MSLDYFLDKDLLSMISKSNTNMFTSALLSPNFDDHNIDSCPHLIKYVAMLGDAKFSVWNIFT